MSKETFIICPARLGLEVIDPWALMALRSGPLFWPLIHVLLSSAMRDMGGLQKHTLSTDMMDPRPCAWIMPFGSHAQYSPATPPPPRDCTGHDIHNALLCSCLDKQSHQHYNVLWDRIVQLAFCHFNKRSCPAVHIMLVVCCAPQNILK